MPADVVLVARCPVHGLHGKRESCFVCDATVEQVPMIALRADPLRAYIREQMKRVECPRCGGTGRAENRWPTGRCPLCIDQRTVPRYQAEGGAGAFIAGLGGRL